MVDAGFTLYAHDDVVARWAQAAHVAALRLTADPEIQRANLRHQDTWFVGVDALPNAADGSISGVPLAGRWQADVAVPSLWHAAQLSVVYPGYPGRDPHESEANHRFRVVRHAAHVDGLLPEGPARRRYLREPHAFILGLPLNISDAAPLMVWPGSHKIMGAAFAALARRVDLAKADLTETYQAARRSVFEQIEPVPVVGAPGQVMLLHRHLLHGVAPWSAAANAPPEGRMIAYFRPQFSVSAWGQQG